MSGSDTPLILHATTVALDGRGVLILGPSGAGKSALGLELMALGCALVADDRTELRPKGGALWATCPAPIRGLIEARGLGLLHSPTLEGAKLALIADLGEEEGERLPPRRGRALLGVDLPLLRRPPHGLSAAAVLHYLRYGRAE